MNTESSSSAAQAENSFKLSNAIVLKSASREWPAWAVICNGKNTRWYRTEAEARTVAQRENQKGVTL